MALLLSLPPSLPPRRLQFPTEQYTCLCQILANGDDALDILRADARRSADPSALGLAYRSRSALRALMNQRCRSALLELAAADRARAAPDAPPSQTPRPIEDASIILAEAFHPKDGPLATVIGAYLDDLAAECRLRLCERPCASPETRPPREVLEVLNSVLFKDRPEGTYPGPESVGTGRSRHPSWLPRIPRGEGWGGIGLRGNQQQYYAASNSMLHKVLSTGYGLPISLCIVHAAVARRLGLCVSLANVPMHVFNRFRCERTGTELFIDAFESGRILVRSEVRDSLLARGLPGLSIGDEPFWTEAMSATQIATRMLMNLHRNFVSAPNSAEDLITTLQLQMALHPDVTFVFKLAQLHLMSEEVEAAEDLLKTHEGLLLSRDEYSHVYNILQEAVRRAHDARSRQHEEVERRSPSSPRLFKIGEIVRVISAAAAGALGVIVGWSSPAWSTIGGSLYDVILISLRGRSAGEATPMQETSLEGVQGQNVWPEGPPVEVLELAGLGGLFESWDPVQRRFIMNEFQARMYPDEVD